MYGDRDSEGKIAGSLALGMRTEDVRRYFLELLEAKHAGAFRFTPEEKHQVLAGKILELIPDAIEESDRLFTPNNFVPAFMAFPPGMDLDTLFREEDIRRITASCVKQYRRWTQSAQGCLATLIVVFAASDKLCRAVRESIAEDPYVQECMSNILKYTLEKVKERVAERYPPRQVKGWNI